MNTIQDRGSIDILAKGLDYKDLDVVAQIKDDFDRIFDKYSRIIQEEVNIEELYEEGEATSKSPNFDDHHLYLKKINNKKARNDIEDLKNQWGELRENNKDLFYYFDGLKGTIIAKGNHPAGMIGSPITLYDNLGVFYKDGDENFPVSFCSMKAVDYLNFVKYDILGLKTVGVLKDIYEYLCQDWKYAYQINWNDENVWNEMIKCNVGIFQFEKEHSFDLLKQFKPKAINDMSLVNASLRPSGKSYRDRLIKKEFNKNPSELIDNLLKNNYGYLVFQEDTIDFLTNVCGFDGSNADLVRRGISKKDYDLLNEMMPKVLEGYCSNSPKTRETSEQEVKEFIQIMEDSAEYQFGKNHSTGYSMNGYLMAYHRYYNPLEFTTAYFNRADNDEDIAYGMKLLEYKGLKLENPKFGHSKGKYFFDKELNTIYKGVGSIKGLSRSDGDKLYELGKNSYNNFVELYSDIKSKTGIDTGKINTLIKLNYFNAFGKTAKLLRLVEIYNDLYDRKQFKKSQEELDKYGLTIELLVKYAEKETAKTFKNVDVVSLINELSENVPNKDISIREMLVAEFESLGYLTSVVESLKNYYFVTKIDTYKNKVSTTYYLDVYSIEDGTSNRIKIKDYEEFSINPIMVKDVVAANGVGLEPKKKQVDDIDKNGNIKLDKNGKPKKKWISDGTFWSVLNNGWMVIR